MSLCNVSCCGLLFECSCLNQHCASFVAESPTPIAVSSKTSLLTLLGLECESFVHVSFAHRVILSVPCAPASVWCCWMYGMLLFSVFATLNLPTCHWLGCSRALKPRRRASSAALVDEPGSDGPWVDCTLRTLCPRHSIKSSGSAATHQGGRWLRPRHSVRSPGAAA